MFIKFIKLKLKLNSRYILLNVKFEKSFVMNSRNGLIEICKTAVSEFFGIVLRDEIFLHSSDCSMDALHAPRVQ